MRSGNRDPLHGRCGHIDHMTRHLTSYHIIARDTCQDGVAGAFSNSCYWKFSHCFKDEVRLDLTCM